MTKTTESSLTLERELLMMLATMCRENFTAFERTQINGMMQQIANAKAREEGIYYDV